MSITNYVLIADTSDAYEIGEKFLSDKFVWHDMSMLALDSTLNDFACILKGVALKEVREAEDVPPILYDGGDNSQLVQLLPADWVELAAKMEDTKVTEVARKLAKENLHLSDLLDESDIPALEQKLKKLRELCQEALANDKSVLLYIGV